MDTKIRFLLTLAVISILIVSCGGAATPATQPSVTPIPINNLTVILVADTFLPPPPIQNKSEITPTPSPTPSVQNENCSVIPDGLGQSYGGKESSLAGLPYPHGRYVYSDVINQITSNGFTLKASDPSDPNNSNNPDFTNDPASKSGYGGMTSLVSQPSLTWQGVPFVKRLELFLDEHNPPDGFLVAAVDTNHLDFDAISHNISTATSYFSNNDISFGGYLLSKTQKIVVNMSFVFVPCESSAVDFIKRVLPDFNSNYSLNLDQAIKDINGDVLLKPLGDAYDASDHNNNFYKYLNCLDTYEDKCPPALKNLRSRLQILYPDYQKNEINKVLIDNAIFNAFIVDLVYSDTSDAAKSWFDQLKGDFSKVVVPSPNVVFVGAVGNFEHTYPFAPASWDFVDGVSSKSSEKEANPIKLSSGLSLAEYSNWGEIQDDGVYFNDPKIVGTSFAAPKFSYKIAYYLLEGGSSPCTQSPNILPVLGYATNKDPSFTDVAGATIANNNMAYSDAMATYCPTPTPTP